MNALDPSLEADSKYDLVHFAENHGAYAIVEAKPYSPMLKSGIYCLDRFPQGSH